LQLENKNVFKKPVTLPMLTYQQKEENFKCKDVILFIPNARED